MYAEDLAVNFYVAQFETSDALASIDDWHLGKTDSVKISTSLLNGLFNTKSWFLGTWFCRHTGPRAWAWLLSSRG